MWNNFKATALVTALLAGTAAMAYAQSSSTLGTGGSSAGSGKSGSSSTLGTGGSTAGSKPSSGSSTTMGTAGSGAGSSMGQQERRAHRFKHGKHRGEFEGSSRAPGLR